MLSWKIIFTSCGHRIGEGTKSPTASRIIARLQRRAAVLLDQVAEQGEAQARPTYRIREGSPELVLGHVLEKLQKHCGRRVMKTLHWFESAGTMQEQND
jgi:hypothetical protein